MISFDSYRDHQDATFPLAFLVVLNSVINPFIYGRLDIGLLHLLTHIMADISGVEGWRWCYAAVGSTRNRERFAASCAVSCAGSGAGAHSASDALADFVCPLMVIENKVLRSVRISLPLDFSSAMCLYWNENYFWNLRYVRVIWKFYPNISFVVWSRLLWKLMIVFKASSLSRSW